MGSIYYLGGSPCSGKSTLAQRLADRYHMAYYKLDDHLDEFMDLGARKGDDYLKKAYAMTGDQLWMRDPAEMAEEELEIYRRIYKFSARDLNRLSANSDVIAEGAGFLPELMQSSGVAKDRYLCLVPKKSFQYQRYSTRPWINYVLMGCSDRDKAFENWMERDAIFAIKVRKSAESLEYRTVTVDGSINEDKMQTLAEELFGLKLRTQE